MAQDDKKKKKKPTKANKKLPIVPEPSPESSSNKRANFNPRELAGKLSENINKGRKAKNKLGKLPIRSGADSDNSDITRYLSTGTSALDAATGGGFACGRMSMVYGPESAGKSLLLESAILAAQERGGIGCVIDSEHTFNKARFTAKGGDIEAVMFIEAVTLEDGFKYIEKTIKCLIAEPMFADTPIVVGWDTINTNQTYNMRSGNQYASGMMEAPRVIWNGFRQLTEIIAESNVALVILNQMYGDKIPPGGRALRYYASLVLYLEQGGSLYESYRTGRNGKMLTAEVIKNKSNPPVDDPVFFACDSLGVDDAMSIYFNCRKRGVGKKEFDPKVFKSAGSWSGYILKDGTELKWQNEKGFYRKTLEYPELLPELAKRLWEQWPAADPSTIEADSEFVSNFGERNPWMVEGERYSRCLNSEHICPVSVWKECRLEFWAKCTMELEDVEPLDRVYHCPPDLDGKLAELVVQLEEEDEDTD